MAEDAGAPPALRRRGMVLTSEVTDLGWPVPSPTGPADGPVEFGSGLFLAYDDDGSTGEHSVFGRFTKVLARVSLPVAGMFMKAQPAPGEHQDDTGVSGRLTSLRATPVEPRRAAA